MTAPLTAYDRLAVRMARIATLGEAGAIWARGPLRLRQGIAPACVVDTMGAGDAFIAGYLAATIAGTEPAAALAEYRALLPYFENQYVSTDRDLPLEVRRRIGHLLLALGDRPAAQDTLLRLLHDAEQRYGPGHPLPAEVRRTLHWLGLV